jgi:hypothetical protein
MDPGRLALPTKTLQGFFAAVEHVSPYAMGLLLTATATKIEEYCIVFVANFINHKTIHII